MTNLSDRPGGLSPAGAQTDALGRIIARSKRLVFFGGAGVSTASGIPDFRSPDGLNAERGGLTAEQVLSKSFFYLQTETFFAWYRAHMLFPQARPNAAHRYLAALERRDVLRGVVTQNVDGLHRMAGSRRLYELHGSVAENYCTECLASFPPEAVLNAPGIPRCPCGGVIRPGIVLYGEPLEPFVCIGARREIAAADTLIVAGTSLSVEPAASMIDGFRGRELIVINRTPTPADGRASLVIRGDVSAVFGALEAREAAADGKPAQTDENLPE